MKVTCPECNEIVPAENINIKALVAKCNDCDNVFDWRQSQIDRAPKVPRNFEMPEKFEVYNRGGELFIAFRWFNSSFIALTIFCIIWDGFMAFWFSIAFFTGEYEMALFGSLHGMVGVGLTYYTIAGYINKTYIGLNYNILKIKHAPLPFWGNREIPVEELSQLYVKRHEQQGKNKTTVTYQLHATLKSGEEKTLVTGFDEPEKALYLEQEIEKFLRIKDEPVAGELPH